MQSCTGTKCFPAPTNFLLSGLSSTTQTFQSLTRRTKYVGSKNSFAAQCTFPSGFSFVCLFLCDSIARIDFNKNLHEAIFICSIHPTAQLVSSRRHFCDSFRSLASNSWSPSTHSLLLVGQTPALSEQAHGSSSSHASMGLSCSRKARARDSTTSASSRPIA